VAPCLRRRVALTVALAAGMAACDGYGLAGPRRTEEVAFGGATNASAALAGTWSRRLLFLDDNGFANGTETTWGFNADGTATRVTVTANFTLGLSDTQIATATWRVEGTVVRIEWLTPVQGSVALEFRVAGSQLTLAGQVFTRVAAPG
jgi:hypothetical protein